MLLQNVIASQLSKNFSASFAAPFFNWECKGSRFIYSSKFFFGFFSLETSLPDQILLIDF
jgi:hypothetical protein